MLTSYVLSDKACKIEVCWEIALGLVENQNIFCGWGWDVANKNDEDFCEKKFPSHHDFADGIFSIGCACELSITYGFELMLGHESPRHFFKFLMNRKVNFKKLDGVVFDFACGLQRYALNREPENFQYLRFLVDGCHFQGQKKLRKPDSRSGRSGHLGCSSGYNWSL